uniref:Flavoprotein domain-containing protein n=1 Tax=Chaetoceros debilis TaxID=122233 RepID=A0A7S3QF62_9STRA
MEFCKAMNSHGELSTKRRKRVLLGISGSVAAIKGPELAIQLTKELDAHVVILLTRGGENFWCKAQEYNPKIWEECNSMMREEDNTLIMRETKEDATGSSTQTPSLPEPPINDESRRMMLFSKYLLLQDR